MIIKSFLIENRGRLHFHTKLDGKYPAKLLINEVSTTFKTGQTVALEVEDHTVTSKYGSARKFTPISVKTADDAKQYAIEEEILRNLVWARQNIKKEIFIGKAISFVLSNADKARSDECRSAVDAFLIDYEDAQNRFKLAEEDRKALVAAGHASEFMARTVAASMRELYDVCNQPAFGVPVRLKGNAVVFTRSGKRFQLNDSRDGCYCYYRPANADEIVDLEGREAIEAERVKGFKRFSKIATRIKNGERPKDLEGQISGEHIEIGKSETFVIGTDYIWHLHFCGVKDVGNYGDLSAYRIPYNKKLAAEVRELAENLNIVTNITVGA